MRSPWSKYAWGRVRLTLSIFGVPRLSLEWFKEINGRREYFIVEGIEAEHVSST